MTGVFSSKFWAITCYFNPVGYKRRIANYCWFRQNLNAPLVAVELSFDGKFQLRQDDADLLVQIHGRDVLWQKERLLNIALKRLPDHCNKVAWLDCDVIFENDDWVEEASRALDDFPLLHLFQTRCDLPRDVMVAQLDEWNPGTEAPSMVSKLASADPSAVDLLMSIPTEGRLVTNGLGWASRREVLAKHGFYDACIVGGGDRAMLCAALGKFDCCIKAHRMNARRAQHYLRWAQGYFATVRGRIHYIPGRLFHLWHGELQNRQYEGRHRSLEHFDFDPFSDLILDADDCWRWKSDKPELHAFVRNYFKSRKEDDAS